MRHPSPYLVCVALFALYTVFPSWLFLLPLAGMARVLVVTPQKASPKTLEEGWILSRVVLGVLAVVVFAVQGEGTLQSEMWHGQLVMCLLAMFGATRAALCRFISYAMVYFHLLLRLDVMNSVP
jgi:hypothetical protein